MLREALDFPTSGAHGSRALLAGSGLLLLGSLLAGGALYAEGTVSREAAVGVGALALFPAVAVRGYYYRALKAAATTRHPTAPSFAGIGSLLKQGLVSVLVGAAYVVPAGLLFGLAAGTNLLPESVTPDVATLGEALGAVAALFGIAALLAALYFTPAAMAAVAREETAVAAFRFRSVAAGAATEDYAVGWVLATALQWVLAPIAIGFSGLLVGVPLYFLTAVAARYVWGASFGAALGIEPPSVPRVDVTPSSTRSDPDAEPSVARVGRTERHDVESRHGDEG